MLTDDAPTAYQQFATEYYEVDLPADAVHSVYRLRPLTDETVKALNPDLPARAAEVYAALRADATKPTDAAQLARHLDA